MLQISNLVVEKSLRIRVFKHGFTWFAYEHLFLWSNGKIVNLLSGIETAIKAITATANSPLWVIFDCMFVLILFFLQFFVSVSFVLKKTRVTAHQLNKFSLTTPKKKSKNLRSRFLVDTHSIQPINFVGKRKKIKAKIFNAFTELRVKLTNSQIKHARTMS